MYYLNKNEAINNTRMLIEIIKDPWTYKASLATGFFLSVQWLSEYATPLLAFIGTCIGLVGIIIGVRKKILENKILEAELRMKERQEKNARKQTH